MGCCQVALPKFSLRTKILRICRSTFQLCPTDPNLMVSHRFQYTSHKPQSIAIINTVFFHSAVPISQQKMYFTMANLSRTGVAGWSIRQLFIQHSTCTVFVFPVYYYPIHQYLFFSDQEDIKKTPSLGVRAFVFFQHPAHTFSLLSVLSYQYLVGLEEWEEQHSIGSISQVKSMNSLFINRYLISA